MALFQIHSFRIRLRLARSFSCFDCTHAMRSGLQNREQSLKPNPKPRSGIGKGPMLSFCGWVGLRGHLHDQSMALNLIDLLQHKNKLNLKQFGQNNPKPRFRSFVGLVSHRENVYKAQQICIHLTTSMPIYDKSMTIYVNQRTSN